MSDITMEKKLKLVQQIRSQYDQNQYDLSNREQLLYGRTSCRDTDLPEILSEGQTHATGSFRIRMLLACLLFLFIVAADQLGISPAGISVHSVFEMIETDYQENMDDILEVLSAEADPR